MRKKISPYPCWKMAKDKNQYLKTYSFAGEELIALRFCVYDECTDYKTVMVPKTTGSFSYDEGLLVDIVNTPNGNEIFNIQIEHSESASKHKSNFVEFIARNTIPYLGESGYTSKLRSLFQKTNYLIGKEGELLEKFSYKLLDGTDTLLTERRLFKEFGPYADELF